MPIEIRNLSYTYMPGSPFETAALSGISLNIQDGEFVGIIGHTGSGKSTLIMHLNGLLRPTSGTVIVDGMDLSRKETDLRMVRRRVGLVFQYPEYQLFEETVLKDVMFGPKNLGMSADEAECAAREALSTVGLTDETLYAQSPFELSGGQKRRVAVAGVLAMKPGTLILDEPAAGLDPRGHDEMMRLMKYIHKRGTTVIMVTHSMTDVSNLCSRVLIMDHGRLVADGSPESIFYRPDVLRKAGLEIPPCAELAQKLRKAGIPVSEGIYTQDFMADALFALMDKPSRRAARMED